MVVTTFGSLYLGNGQCVNIDTIDNFNKLCNENGAETAIEINGVSFKKLDIIRFEFGSDFNNSNTIGNNFLRYCTNLESINDIPNLITSIGDHFLSNCDKFNANIVMPNVESIGKNFLYECAAFEGSVSGEKVKTIGNEFIASSLKFNSPINFPNIEEIGNSFLGACVAFNSSFNVLEHAKKIGTGFLTFCSSFNTVFNIKSCVETIGDDFLKQCTGFNATINCLDNDVKPDG
jgi:hypothetical protein